MRVVVKVRSRVARVVIESSYLPSAPIPSSQDPSCWCRAAIVSCNIASRPSVASRALPADGGTVLTERKGGMDSPTKQSAPDRETNKSDVPLQKPQ